MTIQGTVPYRIRLLGDFQLRTADGRDLTPPGRKLRALLASLALPPGTAWPRERLTALLWSDRGEEQARGSLRQALAELRRSLSGRSPLLADRDTVALDPTAVTVDAVEFERLAKAGQLKPAAELYSGDLLDGLSLHETGFEDWLTVERTRLRDLALDVLSSLAVSQNSDEAMQTAQRLLQIDPANEATHRLLMRLYTERGQRAQALRQYQLCRDSLRRDLGVKPDEATERLLKEIHLATDRMAVRLHGGQAGAVTPVAQPAPSAESDRDGRPKRAEKTRIEPRRWLAAAAIIFALIAADGVTWLLRPQSGTPLPLPEQPSIAVLAFNDLGTDPNWKGLPDALTENVVDDLSRSRDLFVIARNSTEIYKGKPTDARQVGRDLGVKYVLDGTTQTSNDQVRITAQLIEAATGRQVWSGRYDRPLKNIFDIFAVQDDVTQKITGTLTGWEGVVAEADRRMLRRKRPTSLQAHDYYLLGIEYKNRMTKDDNIKAQDLFRKAIKLDPEFARGYVALAITYEHEIDLGYTDSPSRSLDTHLGLIQRALDLDPMDGLAHMTFGMTFLFRNDFDRAASEFERAISLSPNDADMLVLYGGNLAWLGNPQLGLEMVEAAVRRNPNFPMWYNYNLRNAYLFAGNFEAARAAARRIESPAVHDYAYLAVIYAELGRSSEAKAAAAKALRLFPAWSVERFINDTGAFKRDQEMNLFLDGARKAGLPICALPKDLLNRPDMKRLALCRQLREQN